MLIRQYSVSNGTHYNNYLHRILCLGYIISVVNTIPESWYVMVFCTTATALISFSGDTLTSKHCSAHNAFCSHGCPGLDSYLLIYLKSHREFSHGYRTLVTGSGLVFCLASSRE